MTPPITRVYLLLGLLLAAAVLTAAPACDSCVNKPFAEYPSPDGKMKVVVFERNCGATTGFSTEASIVSAGARSPGAAGTVFVADNNYGEAPSGDGGGPELRVRWISADSVEFAHHNKARVFKAESPISGITVRFVSFY